MSKHISSVVLREDSSVGLHNWRFQILCWNVNELEVSERITRAARLKRVLYFFNFGFVFRSSFCVVIDSLLFGFSVLIFEVEQKIEAYWVISKKLKCRYGNPYPLLNVRVTRTIKTISPYRKK